MIRPHRQHPLRLAWLVHRISGLTLALFLPVHFFVLGLAIRDTAALDGFLALTQSPLVKAAEFTLVLLLALHLFGGLRVSAFELLNWTARQKTQAAIATALSFFLAGLFLLRVVG